MGARDSRNVPSSWNDADQSMNKRTEVVPKRQSGGVYRGLAAQIRIPQTWSGSKRIYQLWFTAGRSWRRDPAKASVIEQVLVAVVKKRCFQWGNPWGRVWTSVTNSSAVIR